MTIHRVRQRNATWILGGLVGLATNSCSLLYDFGTRQCSITADCRRMGPEFADSECRENACVARASQGGSSSVADGQSGTTLGGTTGGGGTAELDGTAGSAGSNGTAGQPTCSNERCMAEHDSPTWICRNNACVELTTAECPVLIPQKSASTLLKKQDVIVIGGYASMTNLGNLYESQAIVNWDLVFDDFNQATFGGLPGYAGGGQRPIVGLICSATEATAERIRRGIQHLTQVAEVPAVLSTLSANYLFEAWQYLHPASPSTTSPVEPVFFLSTGSADLRLANLADDGLMWHLLGDPRVLAAPVVALLRQLETTVNAQRAANYAVTGVDNPNTVPLRVTLVYSDEPIMTDIANVLTSPEAATRPGTLLTFNRQSALLNGANFRAVRIDSALQHTTPQVAAAIQDLNDHPPHVIVAMATREFPASVLSNVENTWSIAAPGQIRPHYLMSHLIFNTTQLTDMAKNFSSMSPPLETRVVGVNYAGSQEEHAQLLYAQYLYRLKSTYQGALQLESTENYYDGAYTLLYSLAAAAANLRSPTGTDIAYALKARILSESSSAVSVDVGLGPLSGEGSGSGTISRLFSDTTGYRISLYGTMGPPDFDRFSGTRISATSAWCVRRSTDGTEWDYAPDGLLFDPTTLTYSPAASGIPACLQDYCTVAANEGTSACLSGY